MSGHSAATAATLPPVALSSQLSPHSQHFRGGHIFGCTEQTKDECLSRQLLGLPEGNNNRTRVESIVPRETALFLFNHSRREMYGVFEAQQPGGVNLVPEAFRLSRRGASPVASPFPNQIPFEIVSSFSPLPERCFAHIVEYYDGRKFRHQLNPQQVAELLHAFRAHDSAGAAASSGSVAETEAAAAPSEAIGSAGAADEQCYLCEWKSDFGGGLEEDPTNPGKWYCSTCWNEFNDNEG